MSSWMHARKFLIQTIRFGCMASDKSRPLLITILAILYFLCGILLLLSGIVLALGVINLEDFTEEFKSLLSAGGIVLIIMGIIYLIVAGGFWNGWKIMWYLGVIFTFISLILAIVSMAGSAYLLLADFSIVLGLVLPVAINALLLYYLFRPNVKEFFGI